MTTGKSSQLRGIRLTKREKEILDFILSGLATKQIAGILSISHNTVYNHRRNILKKKGAKKCVDLGIAV